LKHVPVLNQFVGGVASLNGLKDFFVEKRDFTKLYRQVIFVFDSLADGN